MDVILYTSTRCPKCPAFRKLLRECAKELGLEEGKDFVEKLIDGDKVKAGEKTVLEGEEYYVASSEDEIKETPAVIGGQDHMLEALQYQVASTPALIVNGELMYVSQIPEKKELLEKLAEIKR